MVCPECNKFVSPFDDICGHCKKPLKSNPVKDYANKADQIVKDAEARAEDIKEQIRSGFKDGGQGSFKGNKNKANETPVASRMANYDTNDNFRSQASSKGNIPSEGINIQEKSKDILIEAERIKHKLQSILYEQAKLIEDAKDEILKNNKHVYENYVWQHKAEKTFFYFDWETSEINAGVKELKREDIELSGGKYMYKIRMLGGYVNLAYAISSAFVNFVPGDRYLYDATQLNKIMQKLSEKTGCSIYDLVDIFPNIEKFEQCGIDAFRIIYRCIAHELGHICYGHIHSPDYKFSSKGSNHAGEYDADSFAYAMIDNAEDREQMWFDLIKFMLVDATISVLQGEKISEGTDSHPSPLDRLKQTIFRFKDLANKFNIDEKWAEETINKMVGWHNKI
jgi:vacuolar-type H+-ATPase subunit H